MVILSTIASFCDGEKQEHMRLRQTGGTDFKRGC